MALMLLSRVLSPAVQVPYLIKIKSESISKFKKKITTLAKPVPELGT